MSEHILVVTDDGEGWAIECPEGNGCSGWWECRESHEGYDPEDESSPAFDEFEDVKIHGVFHEYRWGHGWTVPYPGCVVAGLGTHEPPPELWDREHDRYKPGRWVVDDDWDDDCCTLVFIGPEGDQSTPDGGAAQVLVAPQRRRP